jgi:molybdopterin/thiamine biosynthesis adenylyltransferase/rhodanese-related sulfurtransferase
MINHRGIYHGGGHLPVCSQKEFFMNPGDKSSNPSNPDSGLSHDEVKRYSRHLIMPEVGVAGQKKLRAASVLIIGAGGLGSPIAMYLAAAGIGHLGLVDYDVVDVSNLQRQIIHGTSDVGRPKTESALDSLKDINPHIRIDTYNESLSSNNALDIIKRYDLVLDGTDNFPTRYLINDACVFTRKPFIFGGIFRFYGQVSILCSGEGPCYRCLFPSPPPPDSVPSCAEGGVLGFLPGTIGTIQASEAAKLILGIGDPLIGRLLTYNALEVDFRLFNIRKDPNCPVCGEKPSINELIDYEEFCGYPEHHRRTEGIPSDMSGITSITPGNLKQRMREGKRFCFLDVREPHELEISRIKESDCINIPANQALERMNELDTSREIIVVCRFGLQSLKVIRMLQAHGFKKLYHLEGGINRWAIEMDPTLPVY